MIDPHGMELPIVFLGPLEGTVTGGRNSQNCFTTCISQICGKSIVAPPSLSFLRQQAIFSSSRILEHLGWGG